MPSAIILLSAAAGTEKAILHCLREQEYVQEAYPVQSAYDIVVRVKAETFDKLSTFISIIKNLLPKPQSVTTMVVVEGQTVHCLEKQHLTFKPTKNTVCFDLPQPNNNKKVTGESIHGNR
jgi:hypothetical protein